MEQLLEEQGASLAREAREARAVLLQVVQELLLLLPLQERPGRTEF